MEFWRKKDCVRFTRQLNLWSNVTIVTQLKHFAFRQDSYEKWNKKLIGLKNELNAIKCGSLFL